MDTQTKSFEGNILNLVVGTVLTDGLGALYNRASTDMVMTML